MFKRVVFSHCIPSFGRKLNGQEPHRWPSVCPGSLTSHSAHNDAFWSFHTIQNGLLWTQGLYGSFEFLVLREKCSERIVLCKEKYSPHQGRGRADTDALTRHLRKIPLYRVERKILNTKDLQFRKVKPQQCVVFLLFKRFYSQSLLFIDARRCVKAKSWGPMKSGLVRQLSDLTGKFLSGFVWFSLPASLGSRT